jgi:uncharacterized protein YerC
MHISTKALSKEEQHLVEEQLALVITEIKKLPEAKNFLDAFLTATEKTVLSKRLAIALMLKQGRSYEEIGQKLKVSSATISTVAQMSEKKGLPLALEKIEEEQWANQKVSSIFNVLGMKKK